MSLLTCIQHFCERQNLSVPNTVYGTTDKQVTQLKALLEEEGSDLSKAGAWEKMIFESAWVTVATESQGDIDTIATNGFNYMINQTIWDRSIRLPVAGPLSPQEWQTLKAMFVNGPRFRWRLRDNELLVNPVPPAGDDWYFEYVTKNWIVSADGLTYREYFAADDDELLVPEALALMGLRWRWKKEKGFDYAEDFRTYEMQKKDALGRDGGKRILSMDVDASKGIAPGIWVSPGTWPV